MQLKNDKKKPITIIYQGKKTIVYPGQVIDGPVQLTIYGLTPITNQQAITVSFSESKKDTSSNNIKSIDETIKYIKSYNKGSLPSVAICILSKDSYHLISDCLDSIETKVQYPNTKVYVFDTGTTDQQTLSYYNSIKQSYKFNIEIIPVGEYHFSKNYNYGLKLVTADYYVIQNNDTVAINDYISKLVRIAIVNKVGACGPRMLYKDGLIQHDGQVLYDHQSNGFGSPTHVNLRRNTKDVSAGIQTADGITCAGMFVRSSVYWEAGGLNETYHDIFQDVELNIKIRMNGHMIVCDRDALIHHYDNTSRNNFWANNIEKLKLKHLDYNYLYSKFNRDLTYFKRENKKISIVTLVSNEEQYINFLEDLKNQDCSFDFEIIALPNFNNEYTGCANALNIGMSLSESEYIILCHQDLRVPKNWLSNIFEKIKELKINDINFGVLGMAGSWVRNNDSDGVMFINGATKTESYVEVQCLDELCMIIKNGNNIKFDEINFPHYHCYGTDFCLSYVSKGYRNFAINCPCDHLSDGFKNLTNIDHLNMFVKNSITLHKKWRNIIPEFRSMTARFSRIENSIIFYVSDELEKYGIKLKKHVILDE